MWSTKIGTRFVKCTCTTSTRPPRQLKRLYLILQALKLDTTSIKKPLQLWKFNFRTFLVMKDACTTSTTVLMTLSYLPSTETGVYKHRTTPTVGEIELKDIRVIETHLYNLHDSENGIIWSSQHWNMSPQASKNLYSCGNWSLRYSWCWETLV